MSKPWKSNSSYPQAFIDWCMNSRSMNERIKTRTAFSLHHDIGNQKSTKLVSNVANVADVLNIQGNPFVKEDMHNLVTFAVMPDYVSKYIENRYQLGRDAHKKFIANRMVDKTVEF